MNLLRPILLLAAAALLVPARAAPPLRVVTLTSVLTEFAATIGGAEVRVTALVPAGVDPHSFSPAPADVRALVENDLVLACGLGLETYLEKITAHSGTRAKIAEVGSALDDLLISISHHGRREPDPHWWHSPRAAQRIVRSVAEELASARPDAAGMFRARAEALAASLAALDAWAEEQLAALPPTRRHLVTTHNAFSYFARDYAFTVHPISGFNTEAEPNARDLARLINLVRREKIPAIFVEAAENPRLLDTVVRETGARLGGTLYAEGLTAAGETATYEGMFRHNVRTIARALAEPPQAP